jgi:hypothetical protein
MCRNDGLVNADSQRLDIPKYGIACETGSRGGGLRSIGDELCAMEFALSHVVQLSATFRQGDLGEALL